MSEIQNFKDQALQDLNIYVIEFADFVNGSMKFYEKLLQSAEDTVRCMNMEMNVDFDASVTSSDYFDD
jgi:hypothetical protein